jgi:hypothetical protein
MLEKAYFRSSTKSSYFHKGIIIAFYVSETLKEFIGFARVTYSSVKSVDEATALFQRQGILPKKQLAKIAGKNNQLHVFTFDNFFEFNNRVSFSKAKELKLISKANLVSPEKLDYTKFKQLIKEAF